MNLTTTTSCIFQHFLLRRKLHLTLLLTTFLSCNLSNTSAAFLMAQELDLELQRYTDSKEGSLFLYPLVGLRKPRKKKK
ncbi:hypothetical protein S83_026974 [Arachis hypogaea]